MCPKTRYLLTQSLLQAWLWQYRAADTERAHQDFLRVLRREPTGRSKAMQDGIDFEDLVTAKCAGTSSTDKHKWAAGIEQVAQVVQGGAMQVPLSCRRKVSGVPLLLYGRLDVLKAGEIYDIKFSHRYRSGKYLDSPQHPMYLALCPEAAGFTYLVSDGHDLYQERYTRQDTPPIEETIVDFLHYLDHSQLSEIYFKNWRAR